MATRKHCIASMLCSLFMSALGQLIDNDSAALKLYFLMAFGNLLKDIDTFQKASHNKE